MTSHYQLLPRRTIRRIQGLLAACAVGSYGLAAPGQAFAEDIRDEQTPSVLSSEAETKGPSSLPPDVGASDGQIKGNVDETQTSASRPSRPDNGQQDNTLLSNGAQDKISSAPEQPQSVQDTSVQGGTVSTQGRQETQQPTHENPSFEALKSSAKLSVSFAGEHAVFDGSSVHKKNDKANDLKGLKYGTVFLRFKAAPDNDLGVLLGTTANGVELDPTLNRKENVTSFFLKENSGLVRYAVPQAQVQNSIAAPDDSWHMVAISSNSSKAIRFTLDGEEVYSNTNQQFAGLFDRVAKIDSVSIGAHIDAQGGIANAFRGSISDVLVTDQAVSDDEAISITRAGRTFPKVLGGAKAKMFNDALDNTWVFTGGKNVAGDFSQVGGARNYIGQFEEYIRWTKAGNTASGMQRYTVNLGREGWNLARVVANFDEVTALHPKATVYMVGPEDYSSGVDVFKANMRHFIEKSTKNEGTFAVIQTPYARANATQEAAFSSAVKEVAEEYKGNDDIYQRIIVVDHFAQTENNEGFKTTGVDSQGNLTLAGHFELGRQLSEATFGSSENYPGNSVTLGRRSVDAPVSYLPLSPTANVREGKLYLTLPESAQGVWKHKVETLSDSDTETYWPVVSGKVTAEVTGGKNVDVPGLPSDGKFRVTTRSADGQQQMRTLVGDLSTGSVTVQTASPVASLQGKLSSSQRLTWLFMGDSITHGAAHTWGYDAVPQAAEKYVHSVLGRPNDIIVNTAVSGSNTRVTLANIEQRLDKYPADIVSIMIGTNDSAGGSKLSISEYADNLKAIHAKIKERNPNAFIVFRTPAPTNGGRKQAIPEYVEKMKEVGAGLNVLVVDQFTSWRAAADMYSFLLADPDQGQQFLMGNDLHPGYNGQRLMTRQFFEALGLWSFDNPQANLLYEMPISERTSTVVPSVSVEESTVSVDVPAMIAGEQTRLGNMAVRLSAADGSWSVEKVASGDEKVVFTDVNGADQAKVTAYAYRADGTKAEKILFGHSAVKKSPWLPGLPDAASVTRTYAIGEPAELARKDFVGFNCHRIPALTQAPNGDLLAAWDGRPGNCQDAPQANSIIMRRSSDGGKTWQMPTVVAAGNPGSNATKYGYSDPSFVVDREKGKIFAFFVKSFREGWWGSRAGTDPEDRNVIHAAVAESSDNGHTWSEPRVITADINVGDSARFAASGEGIQLRTGEHSGRLIQQFTIRKDGQVMAMSVFSDDHGATWRPGTPTGIHMDENKVVELSDGRLMMNSRSSNSAETARKVAYSHDGGSTWSTPVLNEDLIDPRNNASIIRAFPTADKDDPKAKILLFSNAFQRNGRANGTVHVSFDDGQTWTLRRTFKTGTMQYSTLTALNTQGAYGLLYEGEDRTINYMTIDADWLGFFPDGSVNRCTGAAQGLPEGCYRLSVEGAEVLTQAHKDGVVHSGDVVRVKPVVPAGKRFVSWKVEGLETPREHQGSWLVTMREKDAKLTALFEDVPVTPEHAAKVTLTTKVGTAPALPETVEVLWSDGSTTQEKVVWDKVDPSLFSRAGKVEIKGTVTVPAVKGSRPAEKPKAHLSTPSLGVLRLAYPVAETGTSSLVLSQGKEATGAQDTVTLPVLAELTVELGDALPSLPSEPTPGDGTTPGKDTTQPTISAEEPSMSARGVGPQSKDNLVRGKTVTSSAKESKKKDLAFTGASVGALVAVSGSAVLVGLALLARRRRS